MKMRIGPKLMWGSAVGVLAAVFAVSFAAYRIARDSLEGQIFSHLESVAQSRAAHVETFLAEHKEMIEMAATSYVLADGLRSLQTGDADVESVVQHLNGRMHAFVGPREHVTEMFLLDRHGVVVASSAPESVGLDRSSDAYFLGGREGAFIKDAYRSSITGRDSLAVSAPMFDDEGGDLLGVLVARATMAEISSATSDHTGLGESGETYLINRYGFMITPSRFREDTFLKQEVDSENARECLAALEVVRRGILAEEHEHKAVQSTDYRGGRVLGVHAHVPEMGWGLLAEIDAAEAFAPIARLQLTLAIFAVALAAAGTVVAFVFAHRIGGAIHELHLGSERIGSGELDYRLNIKTGDEIEQLADEFNRMAGRLSESYASLERRVEERTAELTRANESLEAEITERKRAEEEVQTLNERMEFILGATNTGIDIIDSNFNIRYIDPQWQKAYGDPNGRKCYEYFMGRSEVCPDCGIVKALETKRPAVTEEVLPKENNRPIQVTTMPFQDEAGEWLVAEVNVDITERKRAEEALRASESKYRTLLENIPQNVFSKDTNLVYLSCNEAFARDLGITTEEFGGKTDFDFFPRELAEKYRADDRRIMESGQTEDIEEAYVKDGKEMIVHTVKTPVADEQGNLVGLLGIFWDITERKRAEDELERYSQQLESLNAELKRSNRDLQEFTYTVSHDLQEPLRKIHAFGQFLEEDCGGNIPEEGRQHLHRMQDAAVRMKGLIEHLLSLARVGTQGRDLVPVDPRPIIDEAVDVLSERVRECGAEVAVEDGIPPVMADAAQLGQLFQNLVGNALKFRSPERVPRVVISSRADGPEATFSVADNGIGIEERFREKIFGVFQRLHPKEQYEGAGVGLALCEKIVRRHGGRIWVDSQSGEGSTFHFTLSTAPAAKEKDHEQ